MDHKLTTPPKPSWPRKKTPESSMIAEFMYAPEEQKLFVHFGTNDSVYTYVPVDQKKWDALDKAASAGAYFSKHIRGNKSIKAKPL